MGRVRIVDLSTQFLLELLVPRGLQRNQESDQFALFNDLQMGGLIFQLRQRHSGILCDRKTGINGMSPALEKLLDGQTNVLGNLTHQ